jgi:spermidine synthase
MSKAIRSSESLRSQRSGPRPAPPGGRRPVGLLLPVCLFCSGLSSLVLEVAWSRSLSLSLGNSHQAVATVVASMMAGLCLGSLVAARRLHRPIPNLVRAYGAVEMGIGGFAVLTPLLFALLPLILGPLYALPASLFNLLRFLMVFTLLLPASAGMGATLPLATAALAADRSAATGAARADVGSLGGRLYGLNTLGAFAGTLAGGFLLLPGLGLLGTILAAGATSFAVGITAWSLGGSPAGDRPAAKPASDPANSQAPAVPRAPGAGWILPLYAASGAVAMIFEITWTRSLAPLVGSSVYSFTLILGAILAGIGAGSLALSHRRLQGIDPAWGFAAGELLLSFFAFLSTWGLKYFPELLLVTLARFPGSPVAVLSREFALFFVVVLPPALILGALFPFAARLARRLDPEAGAEVGRAYAWNTAGGIAGSLAAGFYLVEALGSERTLVVASAAGAVLALAALRLASGRRSRIVAAAAAAAMALAFPFLSPSWDLYLMTSGVTQMVRKTIREGGGSQTGANLLATVRPPAAEVVFHKEGKSSTVTVVREKGHTFLRVDGKTDASTLPPDMLTQVLLGQVPFFFAATPDDACVIGYGSGVTSHAVLTHPVRHLDNIEIERQVVEASPFFEAVNSRPLNDPRSRLILDDARSALAYRAMSYDVIISEPSNPWIAGVNNLFTREFYQLVRRRLKPGGVFCQWVQIYEMSGDNLRVILDTVASSFPHTHLFASQLGADLLILASEQPLALAPGAASLFPDRPGVAEDLGRIGVRRLEDLALRYTAPLPVPDPGASMNTDDNSFIQYRAPLDLIRLDNSPSPLLSIPAADEALMALFFPGRREEEVFPKLALAAGRLGAKGTVEAIAVMLERKGHPDEAREVRGAPVVKDLLPGGSGPVDYLALAEEKIRAGDGEGAIGALSKAESLGLQGAEESSRAGYVWLKVRHFADAERRLDAAYGEATGALRYRTLAGRGAARYSLGRKQEGLADLAAAKRLSPDDPLAYLLQGWAYREAGESDLARQELQEGLKKAPGDPRLIHALDGVPSR